MKTKILVILSLNQNNMKRLFLVFSILFSIILANAQNPFEAYSYSPKIATLSNGKYNEFHDLDTIVQIGTVLFNTQTKQIVAFLQVDTLYSEASLQPDIVSMWMSPDPLSDERPSLSPYNYCQNNPIILVDPDGRLDDYYLNLKSGQVEYHAGSENRFDQGLVNIAGDNATVGDIQDALTKRNYNYQKDPSVAGGFRVDTEKQYKGWAMMQYYSPDIVGTILFMSLGTGGSATKSAARTSGRFFAGSATQTILKTSNGIKITGFTKHGLNRAIERGVKPDAILDAIKDPLKTGEVITDQIGRQSQRFIGRYSEVLVSPQSGKIISVNPTSANKAANLLKEIGQ